MDAIIFADALSGKELHRSDLDIAAIRKEFNIGERQELKEISLHEDGKLLLLQFQSRYEFGPQILVDPNLKSVSVDRLETPPYFGKTTPRLYQQIIWERRLLFVAGDAVCISNPTWTALQTLRVGQQILGLDIDRKRRKIAVSDHDGEVTVLDEKLAVLWRTRLPAGARLKFLAGGRLAAGTVRGKAVMFSPAGKQLWAQSLNRYSPPEEVEKRWAEIERTPYPVESSAGKWWERVKASVPLGEDEARLKGTVNGDRPLVSLSVVGHSVPISSNGVSAAIAIRRYRFRLSNTRSPRRTVRKQPLSGYRSQAGRVRTNRHSLPSSVRATGLKASGRSFAVTKAKALNPQYLSGVCSSLRRT